MAGNKFNTEFEIHKPKFYKLSFQNQNGVEQSMTGTTKQVTTKLHIKPTTLKPKIMTLNKNIDDDGTE